MLDINKEKNLLNDKINFIKINKSHDRCNTIKNIHA